MYDDKNNDKDSKIWQTYVKGVKPIYRLELLKSEKYELSHKVTPFTQDLKSHKTTYSEETLSFIPKHKPLSVQINNNHAFQAEKNAKKRMKKGCFIVNAQIDLHGQTQEQAFDNLQKFITYHYKNKTRHLLIITGRGRYCYQTLSSSGVLIKKVPEWLKDTPFASMISVIEQAAIHDGGEGALYVILRKNM